MSHSRRKTSFRAKETMILVWNFYQRFSTSSITYHASWTVSVVINVASTEKCRFGAWPRPSEFSSCRTRGKRKICSKFQIKRSLALYSFSQNYQSRSIFLRKTGSRKRKLAGKYSFASKLLRFQSRCLPRLLACTC